MGQAVQETVQQTVQQTIQHMERQPFKLNGALLGGRHGGVRKHLGRWLETAVEKTFYLDQLNRLYAELPATRDDRDFLQTVLRLFNIDYRVAGEGLGRIPHEGGLVIVANHPFGAIEGVVMAAMLRGLRNDVKILANGLLLRVPEIRDLFIGVDVFGGRDAKRSNGTPLKEALRWVEQGGVLVVFPAGEVAHFDLRRLSVTDPAWQTSVGRLVRRSGAPVLPMYFEGSNGAMFQLAGMLHPRLRTALLPREMVNKRGQTLELHVGELISAKRLGRFKKDAGAITDYLRLRTEMLKGGQAGLREKKAVSASQPDSWQALIEAESPQGLAAEVAALPARHCLVEGGEFAVFSARARQIPRVLNEIGRLREQTFREAGEGTGRAVDIDLYDSYYTHLFVWHVERREVVGAYRLGKSDDILERFGKKGLYTHSLFRYKRRLLNTLGPALELGRSFIRREYQRSFSPLMLLWKGIGQYVARHPRYKVLFGPVSISNDYHGHSQQLMIEFLKTHHALPELGRLVRPRQAYRQEKALQHVCSEAARQMSEVDDVSELVAQLEADGKGVPILLRQYLKLGGRILAFNVDKDFNNAIDGLIMVDLSQTDPRVLKRYMGDAAEAFLEYHGEEVASVG